MSTRPVLSLAALLLLLSGCRSAPPIIATRSGTVLLDGGDTLAYRLVGSGRDTLLVIPGGGALGSRYLETALAPLGQSHLLVFIDPRGRGGSSVTTQPESLSLARDARDLAALHDSLHLGTVGLIGHHWGAGVALRFALARSAQVGRVVLVSPMAHKQDFIMELALLPNDSAALARHMEARTAGMDSLDAPGYCRSFWGFAFSPVEETAPSVVTKLAPDLCADPAARLRQREAIQRQLYLAMPGWDWSDSIPLLHRPTLVLTGDAVPALVAGAKAWAGRLPDSRLVVTKGSSLFPWAADAPAFGSALKAFVDGSWPAGALDIRTPPDTVAHP
ncbi:MAG: alpha/beta hydrolase [Gemmatimonadota bacterium]|nr:alpha/beta hydrolase [Gemmatimonadota bacterium]